MLPKNIIPFSFLLYMVTVGISCKKFLEIPAADNLIDSKVVFLSDEKATAAMMGVYANMANNTNQFSNVLVTIFGGIASDELLKNLPSPEEDALQKNEIANDNSLVLSIWKSIFQNIYYLNQVIEGVQTSEALSAGVRARLEGEAKFTRAFSYFYLVNLFGNVPLVTTTDYSVNMSRGRDTTTLIYDQIVKDLIEAKDLMTNEYPVAGTKIRPNKQAAAALLARVYLYRKQWQEAVSNSNEVIGSNLYTPLITPSTVFLKNSKEAIWQLGQTATLPREFMIGFRPVGGVKYYLADNYLTVFAEGDKRRHVWIDSSTSSGKKFYYPGKLKNLSNQQFTMVLRVGEQFLVRAEAKARLGDLDGAANDINSLRVRAGLENLEPGLNQEQLLAEVEKERRRELFAEMAHRWFDLKRTGKADSVLSIVKGAGWQETDTLFPIPLQEILANTNLKQNKGY